MSRPNYYILQCKAQGEDAPFLSVYLVKDELIAAILRQPECTFRVKTVVEIGPDDKLISEHNLRVAMGQIEADKPWTKEDDRTVDALWKSL